MALTAPTAAIILAAGKGTRMKSRLPKVLHCLMGQEMVSYPIQAAQGAGVDQIMVVVGHGAETVSEALQRRFPTGVRTTLQTEQRGTGDAARCGAAALGAVAAEGDDADAATPGFREGYLLIVNGDAALVTASRLQQLLAVTTETRAPLGLLVSEKPDAHGYGRILRDGSGHIVGIREQKDCSTAEQQITEWNPGVYAIEASFFNRAISQLSTDNAAGELYLTDLVALAAQESTVAALSCPVEEVEGINDRLDLAYCEQLLRQRILRDHARAGVTLRDPASTSVDADVVLGTDVILEAQVHLRRGCHIADNVHIDVGCVLDGVRVAEGARLRPYTIAQDSEVGPRAQVGPFSHLRPLSQLGADTRVGNFVEIKKTVLGDGSKANHLAYLGDGVIGTKVNVGAGVIFCNYDGFNKHQTVLEDDVFVGSDSQLVAPVRVGQGAYIGTGTTVTQDVPEDALAIGRARQSNKLGWASRLKKRLRGG